MTNIIGLILGVFACGAGAKMIYLLATNSTIVMARFPNIIDGIVFTLTGLIVLFVSLRKLAAKE